MKEKHMKTAVWVQYIAALAVMTINLTAHFLFLISETGWIHLRLGEWMQGWLFLYPLIWLVPLLWMLILSCLTGMIGKRSILIMSILPLTMLIGRMILDAQLKPWYYPAASWVFAVIQLILLIILWWKVIEKSKHST